ncbi:MAG TPA: hypothetical protein VK623_06280 [Flavobacterium sp.]|nr:hypothetical protein [Flavobacterium sp.]
MGKKLLFISLLSVVFMQAQQIQWASKAIKYSSDLGGKQNGIKRILGRPDAFPQGGSSPNAWTPKNALGGSEYVIVGFENPQTIKQVAIFENLNAGCAMRILTDNGSGKFETAWARKPDKKTSYYSASMPADRKYYYNRKRRKIQAAPDVAVNAGIEYAILDNPVSNVAAVKVEFNFALLPGQKQIDAIGISDSVEPIVVGVNTISAFENLQTAQMIDFGNPAISNPVVSSDGKKLYFTAEGENKGILYSSANENGKWVMPKPEIPALNDEDSYNLLEAANADFILKSGMSYNRGTGETGFEILENKEGKYFSSGPLKIVAYNNYDDTAEATINTDGSVLILGIETDLTQGGADLYFAKRKDDGTYSLLENFGKTANSAADESMPYLLSDGKTLLFCSNGFSCYGDFDIYVTTRLDDSWKKWSEPINLGSKINSAGFDGSPFYDETSEMLYFIRMTDGSNSLYSIKLPLATLAQRQ